MRSIKFPNMFSSNTTNVWKSTEYKQATAQNIKLTLYTQKGELICDPAFGLNLKKYFFDQNNYILRDAIIDMIYNQLAIFIPQVKVKREDIEIVQNKEKGKLYCYFHGINQIDYTVDTYSLILFNENDK